MICLCYAILILSLVDTDKYDMITVSNIVRCGWASSTIIGKTLS